MASASASVSKDPSLNVPGMVPSPTSTPSGLDAIETVHVDAVRPSQGDIVIREIEEDRRVTITFEGLSYYVPLPQTLKERITSKGPAPERQILKELTGAIKPGEVTALMGPSGAGKTTFMDILADRRSIGRTEGLVAFNGKPRPDNFTKLCGYVEQDNILIATLTPREHLWFTALLKLSKNVDDAVRKSRVDQILSDMDLEACADVVVGDALNSGISLGQAKRLNIGIELVTAPPMLFLDEPTSGLDSAMSLDIVRVLHNISRSGVLVACTVHQPSEELFGLFDNLVLLLMGEFVYFGKTAGAVGYFGSLGFHCPDDVNPADYIFSVISGMGDDNEVAMRALMASGNGAGGDGKNIKNVSADFFIEHYKKSTMASERKQSSSVASSSATSRNMGDTRLVFTNDIFWNTKTLIQRDIARARRDDTFWGKRVIMNIIVAFVLMSLYVNSPLDERGVRNRMSLLVLIVGFFSIGSNQMIGPLLEARNYFIRERQGASYQVGAYYLATSLFEFPFAVLKAIIWTGILYFSVQFEYDAGKFFVFLLVLIFVSDLGIAMAQLFAAIAPTFEVGSALHTTFPLLAMIFSGFFILPQSIPPYWIWLYWTSFFNYSIGALMVNEFSGSSRYHRLSNVCYDSPSPLVCGAPAQCSTYTQSILPWDGDAIIATVGVARGPFTDIWSNLGMLILFWALLRLAAFWALVRFKHAAK